MPTVRLIEKSDIQRVRRRGDDRSRKEREEARQLLREALAASQALELTLELKERAETIKLRYRLVAKEENLKLQFRTMQHRPVRNRRGQQKNEAEVLVVQVNETAHA